MAAKKRAYAKSKSKRPPKVAARPKCFESKKAGVMLRHAATLTGRFLRSAVNSFLNRTSAMVGIAKYVGIKGFQKMKRLVKIVWRTSRERYRSLLENKTPSDCCAICYEPLFDKDKVQKMCHTMFHNDCIQTAISNGFRRCPVCRGDIPFSLITQKFHKELLVHTSNCKTPSMCEDADCRQLKLILKHVHRCGFGQGCLICTKMASQLHFHHEGCVDLFCKVPMCFFPWK